MSWGEVVVAVLGALGGIEFIKWLFTRKQNTRVAEAKADDAEFESYRKQIEFNNERIALKDKIIAEKDAMIAEKEKRYHSLADKYHEQTLLVREHNVKMLAMQKGIGEKDAKISELLAERKMKLCERKGCRDRQPQSGY